MTAGGAISQARLRIARLRVGADASLGEVCGNAARISARTLDVARVGVWIFSEDRETLRCEHLYAPGGKGDAIQILHTRDFPKYIHALATRRWVCADDAQHDDLTRELTDGYLRPLGITSMLDAPIFRGDELYGIVCHEHVGPPRHWTDEDRSFAGSVGDVLALVLEQAALLAVEDTLKQQSEELRLAQKMDALGRMAAGVAHDVNNLLSAIDALATVIERRAIGSPDVIAPAHDIRDVTARGARLMRQLLAFSRPLPSMAQDLDLGVAVSALEPILTSLLPKEISLSLEAPPGLVRLRADRSQLEQIVINLVLNARDAMPSGGKLRVAVTREHGDAVIAVADDGTGMTPEVRARVFEPFFTTKDEGQGTGLGLATVWGIVRSLGGKVDVETTPGAGSRFRIALPAPAV